MNTEILDISALADERGCLSFFQSNVNLPFKLTGTFLTDCSKHVINLVDFKRLQTPILVIPLVGSLTILTNGNKYSINSLRKGIWISIQDLDKTEAVFSDGILLTIY